MPVFVGTAFAWAQHGTFVPWVFVLAIAGAILVQAISNMQNDVGYTVRGGESTGTRTGLPRATAHGWLKVRAVRNAILLIAIVSTVLGLLLVLQRGWPVLAIGAASLLAALAYMGGPRPIAYTPFGELTVFVFFGLIAAVGSYYIQTGTLSPSAWLAGCAIGAIAAAALAVNNIRDCAHDAEVGRRTLVVALGKAGIANLDYARGDLVGHGDGGGGPTREMLERARRLAKIDSRATLEIDAPAAMFERIERDADRGAIGRVARHPRGQFERAAGSGQHRAEHDEVRRGPVHFLGELHRDQRHQQQVAVGHRGGQQGEGLRTRQRQHPGQPDPRHRPEGQQHAERNAERQGELQQESGRIVDAEQRQADCPEQALGGGEDAIGPRRLQRRTAVAGQHAPAEQSARQQQQRQRSAPVVGLGRLRMPPVHGGEQQAHREAGDPRVMDRLHRQSDQLRGDADDVRPGGLQDRGTIKRMSGYFRPMHAMPRPPNG